MAMSASDDARHSINVAIDALRTRRAAILEAAEKAAINDQIEDLQAQRDMLNEADLAGSAQAVADATAAIQASVTAAQAGPFDAQLQALRTTIADLQTTQAAMLAPNRMARTGAAPPPAAPAVEPVPAPAGIPPVGAGHDAQSLAAEYQACFDACVLTAAQAKSIAWACGKVESGRAIYDGVGTKLRVPWYFVAVIHGMEGSFNFGTHLHNGDLLSARTVHEPKGHPVAGNPPFNWADSAVDALTIEGFAGQADWSLPRLLYRLEAYNGFGYRRLGLRTPYLWSDSNLYSRGKYVADGKFDANAVSGQVGAAVMLKQLVALGALLPGASGTFQ
jgi:lysozyme family protein